MDPIALNTATTSALKKKRVLVIDDDENLRKVLLEALHVAGFESDGASNGDDGLKKAFDTHPDAIMLDVMMPKLTGWQVLEKLRTDAWGKKAKVLMLTSLDQADNIAHAMDKDVFNYIVKSDLDLNNIATTVNNLIKNPIM